MWSCLLQPVPVAQPPAAPPAKDSKEVRGVVVEVFTDGLLLVSVGDDDYAEKGDQILLVRPDKKLDRYGKKELNTIAAAKIVSLGKRYSVAKVESSKPEAKPVAGDRISMPSWEVRKRNLDARMQQGGAITINGK
jgi:hypothetical protein